jgi:hypothetical protein
MSFAAIRCRPDYGEATYRPAFHPLSALGVFFVRGLQFAWGPRFTLELLLQ